MSLSQAFLGAASFELPWALQQSGIWAGAISLCIFGAICGYTLKLLGRVKSFTKVSDPSEATLMDVGRAAFGRSGERVVQFAIIAMSLGVLSAYLVFMGSTLHSVFAEYK